MQTRKAKVAEHNMTTRYVRDNKNFIMKNFADDEPMYYKS